MDTQRDEKRACHECGGEMVRGTKTTTIKYHGLESPAFEMPGLYCTRCGEGVVSFKDMQVSGHQLNLLKAREERLLLPDQVKRVRKKLGLTQRDAGLILGGGPNAFFKYERGELLPSRAISSLLRVLEHDPSGLDVLRREQETPAFTSDQRA